MPRIEEHLTHYQLCLTKALALAACPTAGWPTSGWAEVHLRQVLEEALGHWPAEEARPTIEDTLHAVVKADVSALDYRLLIFCDESAVIFGPDRQQTDRLTGWKLGEADDGAPGGIHVEAWDNGPEWITDPVLEALLAAGRSL